MSLPSSPARDKVNEAKARLAEAQTAINFALDALQAEQAALKGESADAYLKADRLNDINDLEEAVSALDSANKFLLSTLTSEE
jgi:hypothetical protein